MVDVLAAKPTLVVQDITGAPGEAIPLDITAYLADTDGSETLSITISGLPSGATLSAGTLNLDGSYTLAPGDLAGLTVTMPAAVPSLSFGPELDLADLLPANGGDGSLGTAFLPVGTDDQLGVSVSFIGDINGDGYDDALLGAHNGAGSPIYTGDAYVVFGSAAGIGADFALSSLLTANGGDGSKGFAINGINTQDFAADCVASAGDLNGDGYDDFVLAGYNAAPGTSTTGNGEGYVIFGKASYSAEFNLSSLFTANGGDGSEGFVIKGAAQDHLGGSMGFLGDVNGDGLGDFAITAPGADPVGATGAGTSYIFYGHTGSYAAEVNASSASVLYGTNIDTWGLSAATIYSVKGAGDFNGDGYDDVIVGAPNAAPGGAMADVNTGEAYLIFGGVSGILSHPAGLFPANGGNGSNGIVFHGIDPQDLTGGVVSGIGDINNDGLDDILISGFGGDPDGLRDAGEAYVVFGQTGLGAVYDLSSLFTANGGDGSEGFVIKGLEVDSGIGNAMSALGDVNGDGIDDFMVSAKFSSASGTVYAGQSYVIYGKDGPFSAEFALSSLLATNGGDGSAGFVVNGDGSFAQSGSSLAGGGDLNGDGAADILIGAMYRNSQAGMAYAIYGQPASGTITVTATSTESDGGATSSSSAEVVVDLTDSGVTGSVTGVGGDANDTITGDVNHDEIDGGNGDDTLFGSDGEDTIYGGAGTDYLDGGDDDDTLYAGAGDYDYLSGGDGSDVLYGSDETDIMDGGAGNDSLYGGAGNYDYFNGGAGNDLIDGGAGIDDRASYESAAFGITVDLSLLTGQVIDDGDGGTDTLVGIETVYGSSHDDEITGSSSGGEFLQGMGGNDIINTGDGGDGANGNDGNDTLTGGSGTDSLNGGAGDDIIDGGSGNYDFLVGGAGNDYMDGGSGDLDRAVYLYEAPAGITVDLSLGSGQVTNDGYGGVDTLVNIEEIWASNYADSITGSSGNDMISGYGGDDTITTGAGSDNIHGNDGIDTLSGGDDNDSLDGGAGNDLLYGGDSSDWLVGDAGNDYMDGGNGIDAAIYRWSATSGITVDLSLGSAQVTNDGQGGGIDTLVGIETIWGSEFGDTITGSSANESFLAWGGNDTLNGGGGNDYFDAGDGDDTITGGSGDDSFYFYTSSGNDTITDFAAGSSSGDIMFIGSYFADYTAASAALSQDGSDVLLALGGGNSIRIQSVLVTDLNAGDFGF